MAILIEQGFDDDEVDGLFSIIANMGYVPTVVGSGSKRLIHGRAGRNVLTASASADSVRAVDFDAIVIPGGYSPDALRMCQGIVELLKEADALGKVIATVSHGPQLLISADVLRGRRVTSCPSIAIDLENAGASWIDRPIVEDGNIISAGRREDLTLLGAALRRALDSHLRQIALA